MMKEVIFFFSLAGLIALGIWACTDADWSNTISSLGTPGDIRCYSGGVLIYAGRSTGKISSESHSDGWFFRDETSRKLVRVSGDCVIEN